MYVLANIGHLIVDAFRSIMYVICTLVYNLIIFCFNVFENLGTARILTNDQLKPLFTNISLILGLFMVFRLTFTFIQYIVNPDEMFDKTKGVGNIVKKIIISVVLLGSVSYIFSMVYRVQNLIVDKQLIKKIIIPSTVTPDGVDGGTLIASNLFFTFFNENKKLTSDDLENCKVDHPNINTLMYSFEHSEDNFTEISEVYNNKCPSDNSQYVYTFAGGGIGSLILGCVALYIIVTYTIQVGIRLFQLAYLQIISPIPIMMYITPKGDETLKKWFNQCTTTFLDFFIRSSIMYLVIYLIQIITADSALPDLLNGNFWYNLYIKAILIIALLAFAKKVPKLIQEIFPIAGGAAGFDYGLNLKKSINDSGAAGIFGAAVGSVGATASNAIHGVMNTKKEFKEKGKKAGFKALGRAALSIPGGFVGGARAGLRTKDITKSFDAVKTTNDNRERRELRQKAGYSALNAPIDKVLAFAGEKSRAEEMIKTAEFRRDALERSKSMQWQSFADKNPTADLSLLTSMQEFEERGKKIWKGIDSSGNERTFNWNSATNTFDATDGGSNVTGNDAAMVNTSATIDKQIKDQNKKIKGLEDAKKKAQS